MAADYAGMLLDKPQTLETFIAKNQHNPTLLQRLGQIFRELAQRLKGKLTGQQRTQAENAAAALEKAYAAAVKAERKAERKSGQIVSKYKLKLPEKNTAPASRQESLQISATDPRNVARYQNEIDSVLNGTAGSDQMVLLGKPSAILARYMESENPLYMPQKSVKKAVFPKGENGGKHGLGRVVLDELLYQLEDPLAITGNTSEHAAAGDHSIVVWTDWKTAAGDSVIVPIRIDATGAVGVYNNVNTVFDAFNPEYVADLMREGNVLYTKNGKSLSELPGQRRQVPKMENGNALSGTIITETGQNVNPKYSLKRDAALEKDFASIREQLEAGKLTEEQADRLREEAVDRLLARQAEEYGRMQPGETPAREITLPRRTDGKTKVSRTVRTILEGKATPELALPGIKQLVAEGAFS